MPGLPGLGALGLQPDDDSSDDDDSGDTPKKLTDGGEDDDLEDEEEDLGFLAWMGRSVKKALDLRVVHHATRTFRCYGDLVYSRGSRIAWIIASAYIVTLLPMGLMTMSEEVQRQMYLLQTEGQRAQQADGGGGESGGDFIL